MPYIHAVSQVILFREDFCAKDVMLHSKPLLWNVVMSCQHT